MESYYLKIIRTQEQIIKQLEKSVTLYFLAGLSLGIFLTLLILNILK